MCDYSSCEFSKCIQRHPKKCIWYNKYKRCKFDPCKFSHEDDLEKLRVDSQKALHKIGEIEKILEEKDTLEDKIKDFESKIDELGLEIKRLEAVVVEKDNVLKEVLQRDDRNTVKTKNILQRVEELEQTNIKKN